MGEIEYKVDEAHKFIQICVSVTNRWLRLAVFLCYIIFMTKIKWTNEKRKLSELVPWPRNPRQIKKDEASRLSNSLEEFDQVETIAIGPENEIYNGHQRLNVWAEELGADFEVDVRVSSRKLSEKEREKLTVYLHKGAAGEWNFDILANEFEVLDLLDWGFDDFELGINPDANEWADAFDKLPEEDRAPFQQITFTLHDDQADEVKRALSIMKKIDDFEESPNENSNGNAIAAICEIFVGLPEYGAS